MAELTPVTRKEIYLAAAGGQEIATPEPVTRLEMFLAKLAGMNVEVPEPVTRVEYFLAAACGMEVEKPIPVTRLEMLLDNISGGENDIPPVTRLEMFLAEIKGGDQPVLLTYTGNLPATITAIAHALASLTRYGLCSQDGTPTPSSPVDIVCNNGALRMVDDELPTGYKRLLGITFDGEVYYVTNYHLRGADTLRFSFKATRDARNIIGCYNSTSATDNLSFYFLVGSSGTYLRYNGGLYRPVAYLNTVYNCVVSPTGVTGLSTGATWTEADFTSAAALFIGWLDNATSPKFIGDIYGSITVDGRANFIPVERQSDGAIGYWDGQAFLENQGTGTPVSLGYDGSHYQLSVVGTPEVLTVSGKNLFDVSTETQGYYIAADGTIKGNADSAYSALIPCKPNTEYIFSGIARTAYGNKRIHAYDANGNWISQVSYASSVPLNEAFSTTGTTPATASYLRISYSFADTDKQLEQGSSATDYEPYVTPQTVGWKNLFDSSSYTEINAYVNANTGVLTAGSPGSMTQYCAVIPCEPNTQYNITGQGTSAWGAFTSDAIGTTATTFVKGGNLTTGANDRYLIGLVRANGDSIDYRNTLVVRKTVTDIPMLLGVGDYKDEQEILSGVVTRKVGVLVLDGTEAWDQYTTGSVTRFSTKSPTGFDIPKDSNMRAYCNILVDGGYQTSGTTMQNGTFSYTSAQSIYLRMAPNNGITTVEGWQQWLADQYAAGTPVIVVYPRATETTEQTTPNHLVTNKGVNVVDSVANVEPVEAKIEYYGTETPMLGMGLMGMRPNSDDPEEPIEDDPEEQIEDDPEEEISEEIAEEPAEPAEEER